MNFVRFLSISILIFFSGFLATADKAKAQSIDFGVSAGFNVSSHLNDFRFSSGDINLSLEPGVSMNYQGGFIARKKVTRTLRIQAEPSLMMLGARYEEPFTLRGHNLQTESQTQIISVQIPLVLQLTTAPSQQEVYGRDQAITTYHLTGGMFGGYLIDARFRGTNTGAPLGVNFAGDFSNDVTSQYSDFDGGVILGAGFEYGQNSRIGLEARGQLSIIETGNAPEMAFNPKNIAATLAVYYMF